MAREKEEVKQTGGGVGVERSEGKRKGDAEEDTGTEGKGKNDATGMSRING